MDNKMMQFKGFKPEAMQRIANNLGYQGDMSGFNTYLNQNPDKKQQMDMYQQKAIQMAEGGVVDPLETVPQTISEQMAGRAQAPTLPIGSTVQPVGTTITQEQLVDTTMGQTPAAPTVVSAPTITPTTAIEPTVTSAATIDPRTVTPQITTALQDVEEITGTVSPQAQVEAAQGTISAESLATAVGVDEKYIKEVQAGTRTVSADEIAKAATALNIPTSQAQQLLSPVVEAEAKKFEDLTPEVTAITDYEIGKMGVAEGEVKDSELVKAEGVGLTAEQANETVSTYESTLEAARGKVADGETITSQDYYNLPVTDVASIQKTAVENAATASTIPQADVAKTSYQSTITGAEGRVGAKELVDAEAQGLQIGQAVEAVAAVSNELNPLGKNPLAKNKSAASSSAVTGGDRVSFFFSEDWIFSLMLIFSSEID